MEQATTRIQAAGYALRGADRHGDVVFGAADSAELVAMFDSVGLVFVHVEWMRDPDRLPARFERMRDSMRTVLGPPGDEEDDFERWLEWTQDGASAELMFRPADRGVDTLVALVHRGPGSLAEFDRRRAAADAREERFRTEGHRDTTALGDYHTAFSDYAVLVGVHTVRYQRLGPRLYRARVLYDWMLPRRLPSGMMYDAWLAEVELDCAAFRSRTVRNIPLYYEVVAIMDVPESERVWTRPTSRIAGRPRRPLRLRSARPAAVTLRPLSNPPGETHADPPRLHGPGRARPLRGGRGRADGVRRHPLGHSAARGGGPAAGDGIPAARRGPGRRLGVPRTRRRGGVAVMDTAGLISVDVRWYERPDEFPRRLQVLVDSLTAAFGEPLNREEESAVWNRQDAWVHLFMRRAYGGRDSMLFLAHTRPGGLGDEPARRGALADAREAHVARHGPDPAAAGAWHLLWDEIWVETRVDTAYSAAIGTAGYRARMLERWQEPRRLENGLMYDGVLTEVELDCKEFRRRLHRTVFVFYQAPVAVVEVPEAERAWFRPGPEQLDGHLLRDACVVLHRQR